MQTSPAHSVETDETLTEPNPDSPADADRGMPRVAHGLRLRGVGHSFGELEVISGLELDVEPNRTVALVGPSGCGKSTALELIAGLDEPRRGTISIGEASDAAGRLERAVYMPQRDQLFPWLRAIDNAALPLRIAGSSRREARETARPLFERLGLTGFERVRPRELSGGMRQRVAFARTLLAGKPVLLLDEPFASLDAITRADLQEWLLEALATEPRTTVLVTHDVEEALFVADTTLVLSSRPARVLEVLARPVTGPTERAAVVTDPVFVAARDRALRALAGGDRER